MTVTEVHAPLHPNTDAVCRILASDADWTAAVDLHAVEHDEFDPAEYRDFEQRRIYRSLGFAGSEIQIQLSRPNV